MRAAALPADRGSVTWFLLACLLTQLNLVASFRQKVFWLFFSKKHRLLAFLFGSRYFA